MSFFVMLGLALCVTAARSAWEESTVTPVRIDPYDTPTRVYQLDVFGDALVLVLEPDRTFLAPGFVFQTLGKPGSEELHGAGEERCFFSGSVRGREHSAAAINVCDGLRGAFSAGAEEYVIQPRSAGGKVRDGDVHVVRRRMLTEEKTSKCGVDEQEERVPEKPDARKSNAEPVKTDSQGISYVRLSSSLVSCIWK